jgi:hypothetical protein
MTISVLANSTTAKISTIDGNIDVAVPAGVTTGDVLICMIGTNAGNITTIPSGWTEFGKISSANLNNPRVQGYWMVYASGSTWRWVMSSNVAAGAVLVRVSGVDTTTSMDVTETTNFSASTGTTLATTAITPVTSGAYLVSGYAVNSSSSTLTKPTEMTLVATVGGKSTALAYEAWDNSSTGITRTWTNTSNLARGNWMAVLRPASTTVIPPGYAFII